MAHPQCCSNPPTLSPTSGAGAVIDGDIGGVRVYASGSADSKLAVVLVSDVYGFEAPNLRTLADKIAASGYYVVVPDLLCGDPFSADDAEKPFPVWIQSHSPVDSFVKIFPGVAHGWSVRYKIDDEPAVKAAEEAHQDILNWFAKTLKA